MSVKPFSIKIEEAVLQDLKERLARTHWPKVAPEAGWTYGLEIGYLQ